jgi:hypothetical protein
MEQGQQLFLEISGQIYEEVSATEDIQLGEWRVHDEILRGEDHHLPDILLDPIAARLLPGEKKIKTLGRYLSSDVRKVHALAGLFDALCVYVRRKYLDLEAALFPKLFKALQECDSDGVGLFASGAARDPDT